jgi:acetyl-CoA C-acetyltransferase
MASVIVAGARTPMGRLKGSLSSLPSTDLGGAAIRAAVARSGFAPDAVDYVIMGQVLSAGARQAPARQAAVAGGLPMSVPTMVVNKVCLSGLTAIALADQMISTGVVDIVVAGGMESMSQAPHLLRGSRGGFTYGDVTLDDHMVIDGLQDAFTVQAMGALTDEANREGTAVASRHRFTREQQDAFAARSHQRAALAWKEGRFAEEVVPVDVPQRKGDPVTVTTDEGVRPDTTVEGLARLKPAFHPQGTITAGTSSQISDGAAAVVVARKDLVEQAGLPWLAEIGAFGMVAGPDSSLQTQPSNAIRKAAAREGVAADGFDLYEMNEAFAAVALASAADLGLSDAETDERVNVNGGAIALGHPVGMSGARLALTLSLELGRRGGGTGVAALCGGGGQGDALVLRVPAR